MKFAVAILLLSLSTVSASSFGQRISLHEKSANIKTLLDKIERQIPYRFVYDNAEIGEIYIENAFLRSATLKEGLDFVLRKQGLTYKIIEDHIIVKKSDEIPTLVLKPLQTAVRGTVRDEMGQPIEGVTVSVKGHAGRQTNTDDAGVFSLALDLGNTTLIFEHIAFAAKEIDTKGRSVVDVMLQSQTGDIEEVVVVGYGTQKKANLTGAVSAISGEELENRPIANIGQGLQGQMPGLTVRSTGNTAPGNRSPQFRIRGVGTWGDANPLIVIDGIPGGNLNILNPNDIENISVLKDAASSSIYGVRGANGVIMVTTKKGTSGKTNVNYNSYVGWQTPTALPDFLGSAEYMTLQNEANVNAGQNPTYTEEQIEIARNGSDPNYFANTDWISETYRRSAPQQNHNLSLNGGADKTQYYASYGYLNEGGLVIGDNFKAHRHNARLRLNTQLLDRLNIDGNLGYVDRSYDGSANGTQALSAATSIRPLVPVRFSNGSWGYHGGQSNPVSIILTLPLSVLAVFFFQRNIDAAFILLAFHMPTQMLISVPLSWFLYKKRLESRAEITTLRTELGKSDANLHFLKSQINPHFLFNALNTLYGTALQEQAERTGEGIQKLGDMMRFMLHENLQDTIPLIREVDYLNNYIALQKLRTSPSADIKIETLIEAEFRGLHIAPMLLIPFVENAFKHGISLQRPSYIKISLQIQENVLYFDVCNSINPKNEQDPEADRSGVGLANVKQRMSLLYKDRHDLIIRENVHEYFVHLTLTL